MSASNTNIPAFAKPHQDIGSKLNHEEALQLLQKAINKYPGFAPEVRKSIKAAEKRSIEEFYKFCDDLATEYVSTLQEMNPCYGMNYEFLLESVAKVTESINEHSPAKRFDVAVECLWTFLRATREYEKNLGHDEHKELGLIHTMEEVLTGLEETIKLWGERDKNVEREMWELTELSGADNEKWARFFDDLVELYWTKRRTKRKEMTVVSNRKRKRTVMSDK